MPKSQPKRWIESRVNIVNEAKRLPILFLLDVSPSMNNFGRIEQLNLALNTFINDVKNDLRIRDGVEIAIVTFTDTPKVVQDFMEIGSIGNLNIEAKKEGATLFGNSLKLALEVIDRQREKYRENHIRYNVPFLVFITDGKPELETNEEKNERNRYIDEIVRRNRIASFSGGLLTFPVGVGDELETEYLRKLCHGFLDEPFVYNDAICFSDFFQILTASVGANVDTNPTDSMEETKDIIGQRIRNSRHRFVLER